MDGISKIENPTAIYYGGGSLNKLDNILKSIKARKILIITDEKIRKHKLFSAILQQFTEQYSYCIYDDIVNYPDKQTVCDATNIAISEEVDTVVAIGGSGIIDAGKVVAIKAKTKEEWDWGAYGIKAGDKLNTVAVVTTMTSVFCNTPTSFIKDGKNDKTITLTGKCLFPDYVIVDSSLAMTLPYNKKVSAISTTLSTILEGYISTLSTPFTDAILLGALEMLIEGVNQFLLDENNVNGLEKIQLAGILASYGVNNAMLGIVAATANTFCGKYCVDFGDVSAVAMVEFFKLSLHANLEKYAKVTKNCFPQSEIMAKELLAKEGLKKITELLKKLRCPQTLSQLGIDDKELAKIAQLIGEDDGLLSCPVIPSSEEIHHILKKIL